MSNYSKAFMQELKQMGQDLFKNERKTDDQYTIDAIKRRLRLTEAQMKDLDAKENKRNQKPVFQKCTPFWVDELITTGACITTGVVTYLITKDVQPELANTYSVYGAMAGAIAGTTGTALYQKRPISRAVRKLASWSNRKKYNNRGVKSSIRTWHRTKTYCNKK